MASIQELEQEHHTPARRQVIGYLGPAQDLVDPRVAVIGPTRDRSVVVSKPTIDLHVCYIHHSSGKCNCSGIVLKRPEMLDTATGSIAYTLSALKNPPKGTLKQADLDFLAYSVSKIAAHWGRLALGHEQLT